MFRSSKTSRMPLFTAYLKNMKIKRSTVTITQQNKSLHTIEDLPQPRSLPIFGTKFNFLATGKRGTRLHEYIDSRHKQLGPIFRESLGGGPDLVFISDHVLMKSLFLNLEGKYPAHILPEPWILYEKIYGSKRGLFFMNGEEWICNRRIMNKHLLREDADNWLESPVKDTIATFIENWKTRAENGSFIPNLESQFYRLSVDVIIKVLLGTQSSFTESKQYEELLSLFSEAVKKIFLTTTKLYGLPLRLCHKMDLKVWKEFEESVNLSLFLAQKIVNEILKKRQVNNGLIRTLSEENMSDEMITRIVADFVIAAGDTTAYTSLWILILLSKNEEITEELRTTNGSNAKFYVKETMRLFPVAPFLTRILPKECVLASYKLNEGTPIIASIYTSGRDESNFSKADEFLPYRWDRNDARRKLLANHVPSASLPFALGARSCIGKKIAMIQLTEVVKQIADNFDLKYTNQTDVKAITSQVLVPNQEIKLKVSLKNKYN